MKGTLTVMLSLMLFTAIKAQDETIQNLRKESNRNIKKEVDTSQWKWKRGGLISAALAQGSLSNWAAGGDNFSLSIAAYFNYFSFYRSGKHTWDNNFDINLGFVQTTSLGSRKNDDRFDIVSKYGYSLGQKWYLSGLLNLRSQFFDGYNFNENIGTFSSTLFSPAYILTSVGFDYKPTSNFSMFLSPLTNRLILVTDPTLSKRGSYGVDSGKHVANEVGAFATLNYSLPISKDITYKSRLDLFSNYKNHPQNLDLFMTNMVSFKINKFLSATYSLDLIYDDDVKLFGANSNSPALQVKSLIGIGYLMQMKTKKKN